MAKDTWASAAAISDERRLLDLAGFALPAAVWLLGIITPPRGGLTPGYVLLSTAPLAGLIAVDRTTPSSQSPAWRRLLWLAAEIALCLLIVRGQANVVRPALIYLLPTSRALLMFGIRDGLILGIVVWAAFAANVGLSLWPDRLAEFPSYFSFFLAPYIVAVVLTLAALRQAADRQRLQALYDELRQAHAKLQELNARARESAVTEERNRLAREIHDSLAHYLTVINLQLEAAEKLSHDQRERALQQVQRARRLTLECLQEVRRSVAALRGATLEELLLPGALDKLVAEFTESTGIPVQLAATIPESVRLSPETRLALYRVAQEGLTNVQRHARASVVRLSLVVSERDVVLDLEDDGVGPSVEHNGDRGGFGLVGLRERVDLLGGHLRFGVGATGGSHLAVALPIGGGT